jgi:hypothetical protein
MGSRVKTYSGQTGYVYEYVFVRREKKRRRWWKRGTAYLFEIRGQRRAAFTVAVFVADDALETWAGGHGRDLSSTEQYALAKMRLFRAFDEVERMERDGRDLVVDRSGIEGLLAALDAS